MGRLKAKPKGKAKTKVEVASATKAEPERSRPANVHIRATQEWRDWVVGLAEHHRMSVSMLVDFALAKIAKEAGYKEKPPKR